MKVNCVIRIDKPIETHLPDVLGQIFEKSEAISQAVSKFWGMKLASSAELGDVKEYPDYFEVTIIY